MWALEFTSHTAGPPSTRMTSTPAKSAPTDSAALMASSSSSGAIRWGSILPPMVELLLKSPSGPLLSTDATTRPPTTSALTSAAPHST